MIALRTPRKARLQELRADLRGYRNLVLCLLVNASACWLIAVIVGGSAVLGEVPYEEHAFIEVDAERVVVPWWLYHFSFWHGFSVFFSALFLPLFTALLIVEHAWKAWKARKAPLRRIPAG